MILNTIVNNNKVSVIIPTYNCAKYIAGALESVLNQSYRNFEIVVVDDGSTDNTKEILNSYITNGLIRYIYQTNQGPGAARNKGVEASSGEYVAFLDADDQLVSNSLESRKQFLDEHQEVMLVFADYFQSVENLSLLTPHLRNSGFLDFFQGATEGNIGKRYFFNEKFIRLYLKFSPHPIWVCTVMVRKSLVHKVGQFRTDIFIGEDVDYWIRSTARYKIGYIDEPLAIYNYNVTSLTKNVEKYCNDAIKMYSRYLDSESLDKEVLHKQMSSLYFSLGYHYILNNRYDKARSALMTSLRYNLMNFVSIKCLIMSFIPLKWLSFLKSVPPLINFEKN
jgi:glycosyltransferase involved in cell wall biosynthesis